ncbi:30S ribosomal protein S19 [Candidatus Hodgkinia cicadicola]|nr:30S ribosomal protein S19 [Candidatus Hodgkinia cicadicola]
MERRWQAYVQRGEVVAAWNSSNSEPEGLCWVLAVCNGEQFVRLGAAHNIIAASLAL